MFQEVEINKLVLVWELQRSSQFPALKRGTVKLHYHGLCLFKGGFYKPKEEKREKAKEEVVKKIQCGI